MSSASPLVPLRRRRAWSEAQSPLTDSSSGSVIRSADAIWSGSVAMALFAAILTSGSRVDRNPSVRVSR